MIIAVASGKGGTGKTTIATNLALSLATHKSESSIEKPLQIIDCDVEEPNAHIFIKPSLQTNFPVFVPVPKIDTDKCDFCGDCTAVCAYNALAVLDKTVLIFPELCHGCGACSYICPRGALEETQREIGCIEIGEREDLQFIHGKLHVGEAKSPPLIRKVKQFINPTRTVIIDAPPGTSCPVIAAVKGSDFCILVTEPTPFGLYDLTLAVSVLKKLDIQFGVIINRYDKGNQKTAKYCKSRSIPVLTKLPFKRSIASVYAQGIPIVEAFPEYHKTFHRLFENIQQQMKIPCT